MALTDPHDPRSFRRYVQFNPDGTVASTHDFDAGTICPLPAAVEITDLSPLDVEAVAISPADVAALQRAVDDHGKKSAAVDLAISELASAASALTLAQATARGSFSSAAGKLQSAGAAVPIAPVVADGG